MNWDIFLASIQIILGVLVIIMILLQVKGTGLGSAFGGEMGHYSTKRGAEKMLFISTIITGFLFFLSALLGVLL